MQDHARVLIASAQPSLRAILRQQLEREPQVQIIGEAGDAAAVVRLTQSLKPDILLIENAMNRELAARRKSGPHSGESGTGIVVIIESSEIEDIVEAFELGARGFVLRASLPNVWKSGIQSVLAGQYWVEENSILLLLRTVRGFLIRPQHKALSGFGLTMREMEIASQIAAGRSNKEVGQEFSICERTVKHHLTNIFKKVGVGSRLELAVLMRGYVAPDRVHSSASRPGPSAASDDSGAEKHHLYVVNKP
jgi:DNA-binding NarL/FixJ family response regulator